MQFFYLFGCREMITQPRIYVALSEKVLVSAETGCEQLQQGIAYSITPGSAMSALGQKQTSQPEISMSALPPKADIRFVVNNWASCEAAPTITSGILCYSVRSNC
jgi:hypothetical protein